jgi:hypothetical protein
VPTNPVIATCRMARSSAANGARTQAAKKLRLPASAVTHPARKLWGSIRSGNFPPEGARLQPRRSHHFEARLFAAEGTRFYTQARILSAAEAVVQPDLYPVQQPACGSIADKIKPQLRTCVGSAPRLRIQKMKRSDQWRITYVGTSNHNWVGLRPFHAG